MELSDEIFLQCLSIPFKLRTLNDISCIRLHLKSIEAMSNFKDLTISEYARIARYEQYKANITLYKYGSLCRSWYILLSGRIMIGHAMFLPGKSFGHRSRGNLYRCDECILLEDSDFIVFDYAVDRQTQNNYTFSMIKNIDSLPNSSHIGSSIPRRVSPRSYTLERQPMSDSDDSVTHESFYSVIRKNADRRTANDISTIFDGIHHLSAFRHFTSKTKYDLCRVMHVAVTNTPNVMLLDYGHVHDTWNVILDGIVEARYKNGSVRELGLGDSFGVRSTDHDDHDHNDQTQNGAMFTVTSLCLFFCVSRQHFVEIIARNSDGIIPEMETNGRVVLVYEERKTGPNSSESARVVIRGTREKLVNCLLQGHSGTDEMFVETFLMTYRSFMVSPGELADKLCQCYEMEGLEKDSPVKMRIRKCLLLWTNNHFIDFDHPDANMEEYLEKFDQMLSRERYAADDYSLFVKACSIHSKSRSITVALDKNRTKDLPFRLIGLQRGLGLFVKEINYAACKSKSSLRRCDQILSLENYSWEKLDYLYKAVYMLNSNSTGSINMVVRYNPAGLREVIDDLSETESVFEFDTQQSDSRSMTGSVTLYEINDRQTEDENRNLVNTDVHRPIDCFPRSPLWKFKTNARSANTSPTRKVVGLKRKSIYTTIGYGSSLAGSRNESTTKSFAAPQSFAQQETELINSANSFCEYYQVLKVFRPRSSDYKLVEVTCNTMTKNAISLMMKEFYLDISDVDKYALYMVSVNDGPKTPVIKSSRVSMYIKDLAGKLALNQRYYLRHNETTCQLITDEQAKSLLNDSKVTISKLSAFEIASRLTFFDFTLFRNIQSTEYINSVLKLPPLEAGQQSSDPNGETSSADKCGFSTGSKNYEKFEELINRESFWPINEICQETNVSKRADLIKKFIKIAKICKDLKNINSFICILTGLVMTPIDRLKTSWEKVPGKYIKMYNDLRFLLDISFNFQNIRRLESPDVNEPPLIPYLAIHMRDLSTMNMGNKTITKDGLINFEKLRMMASQIRKLTTLCNTRYSLQTIISAGKCQTIPELIVTKMSNLSFDESDSFGPPSPSSKTILQKLRSSSFDQFAFDKDPKKKYDKRKSLNTKESQMKNPKKIYDEGLSTLKVRTYFSNLNIVMDINRLQELSNTLEPPSSVASSLSNVSSSGTSLEHRGNDQDIESEPSPVVNFSQGEDQVSEVKSTKLPKHLRLLTNETSDSLSKSIFSFQNPEDVNQIMDLIQDPKKVSTSQNYSRRYRDKSATVDQKFLRRSQIYQNNKDMTQEIGIRQSRNGIPENISVDLEKSVTDLRLESAISDKAYRYPVARGYEHSYFGNEVGAGSLRPELPSYESARAIAMQQRRGSGNRNMSIINDGVTMKSTFGSTSSTRLPSYKQSTIRTNNQSANRMTDYSSAPPQKTEDMMSTIRHDDQSHESDQSDEMTKM